MKHKFCLPLQLKSAASIEAQIKKYACDYDFFEIWLDYLEGFEPGWILNLVQTYPERLIFLFRRAKLEAPKMPLARRIEVLSGLFGLKTYFDLDFKSQADELKLVDKKNAANQLLLSYHNYRETPAQDRLLEIAAAMLELNPAILKISCQCNGEEETLALLKIMLFLKNKGRTFIVLGMGEQGKVTRIIGPLWGNVLSFAPPELAGATAPGQIEISKLKLVLSALGGNF